jgi:hypothetical protein
MCTPDGRLQKLMMGGAALFCPAFPQEVAAFEALHTLQLSIASFSKDTYANAAKVRAGGARLLGCVAAGHC